MADWQSKQPLTVASFVESLDRPLSGGLITKKEESLETMSIHRKLMTGCCVAVLAFGLAACGSSNKRAGAPSTTPSIVEDPSPGESEPTQLAVAQEASTTAAMAAMTASDFAAAAALAAKTASANRATIQTVANSYESAHAAQMAADEAAAAAVAAKTASDAAAAAEDVTSAVEARVAAQTAQADAEAAQELAEAAQEAAEAAGVLEVKIVEKTKSVGETSITINELTVTDDVTKQITGLQTGLKITDPGEGSPGVVGVEATADPPVALTVGRPRVIARPIDIGVTYDSAADDARLTLVTHYLDSQAASAFKDTDDELEIMGMAANTVNEDRDTADRRQPKPPKCRCTQHPALS